MSITNTDKAEDFIEHTKNAMLEDLKKYKPDTLCDDLRKIIQEDRYRWIPISERLPEDRDWYLGIFKEPDTGWINPLPFICDYVGFKTNATTKEHWILRGFTDRDKHIDYYFNLECVAWMPLPKTYKEGAEE